MKHKNLMRVESIWTNIQSQSDALTLLGHFFWSRLRASEHENGNDADNDNDEANDHVDNDDSHEHDEVNDVDIGNHHDGHHKNICPWRPSQKKRGPWQPSKVFFKTTTTKKLSMTAMPKMCSMTAVTNCNKHFSMTAITDYWIWACPSMESICVIWAFSAGKKWWWCFFLSWFLT